MVRILEIGGRPDAEEDEDCCEIDPAEFAKKVNLKSDDDDVVIVAAKGQVELDQSGHAVEALVRNLHECAAGDSLENPYEIEEDETSPRQIESVEAKPAVECILDKNKIDVLGDVKCATDKSENHVLADAKCIPGEIKIDAVADVKCIPDERKIDVLADVQCLSDMTSVKFGNLEVFIPDMLHVKCEPEDSNGIDEGVEEEDAYDHRPKMDGLNLAEGVFDTPDGIKIDAAADVKCIPDESKIDVLADVKCLRDITSVKFGNFEEFIPDMLHVKCKPEDGNCADEGVKEEDAYDHLPEMDGLNLELCPGGRVFDEEDGDDVREAL